MDGAGACEREYAIQVCVVTDATGFGYTGRVVVQKLPDMHELLCEDVLACGRLWVHPRSALAAAYARGRRFVHFELCRELADRWPAGDEGDDPLHWPPPTDTQLA